MARKENLMSPDEAMDSKDIDLSSIDRPTEDEEASTDFFAFDNNTDTESNRSPLSHVKMGAGKALDSFTSSAGSRIGERLRSELPDAANFVGDVGQFVSDGLYMVNDFRKDIAPSIAELKRAGRALSSRVKAFLPEKLGKIYDNLMSDEEDRQGAVEEVNKEKAEDQAIGASLDSIFVKDLNASVAMQQEQFKDLKQDKIIDRAVEGHHFKETWLQSQRLVRAAEFQKNFTAQIFIPYLKKDLELKYRHLFIARDTFKTVKAIGSILENKLDQIRHNTALPDIQKKRLTEGIKEAGKQRFSNVVNDFFKNALTRLKDEFLAPAKDTLSMGASAVSMMADMIAQEDEMSGASTAQKRASTLGFLGGHGLAWGLDKIIGKRFFGKKKIGKDELGLPIYEYTNATQNKFQNLLKQINLRFSNWKSKLLFSAADYAKDHEDTFLGKLASMFAPNLSGDLGSATNRLATLSPTAPAEFTNQVALSITHVIPGYLSQMTRYLEIVATGNLDAEEKQYDVQTQSFRTVSESRVVFANQMLGSKSYNIQKAAAFEAAVKEGYRNAQHTNDLKEFDDQTLKDSLKRFLANSGAYNQRLRADIIGKLAGVIAKTEVEDPTYALVEDDPTETKQTEQEYIARVFRGIDPEATKVLIGVLAKTLFNPDGTPNEVNTAILADAIFSEMAASDTTKKALEEVIERGNAKVAAPYIKRAANGTFIYDTDAIVEAKLAKQDTTSKLYQESLESSQKYQVDKQKVYRDTLGFGEEDSKLEGWLGKLSKFFGAHKKSMPKILQDIYANPLLLYKLPREKLVELSKSSNEKIPNWLKGLAARTASTWNDYQESKKKAEDTPEARYHKEQLEILKRAQEAQDTDVTVTEEQLAADPYARAKKLGVQQEVVRPVGLGGQPSVAPVAPGIAAQVDILNQPIKTTLEPPQSGGYPVVVQNHESLASAIGRNIQSLDFVIKTSASAAPQEVEKQGSSFLLYNEVEAFHRDFGKFVSIYQNTNEQIGTILGAMSTVLEAISGNTRGLIRSAIQGVWKVVTWPYHKTKTFLKEHNLSILGAIDKAARAVGSKIATGAQKLWEGTKWVGNKVTPMLGTAADYALSGLQATGRAIGTGALMLGGGIIDAASLAKRGVLAGADLLAGGLGIQYNKLRQKYADIKTSIKDKYQSAKDRIKAAGLRVKEAFSKVRYVDIFIKDQVDPGNPILSAKEQVDPGVYFANGDRVLTSFGINRPVFRIKKESRTKKELTSNDFEVAISKEQLVLGLVDINNKPIIGARSLIGKIVGGAFRAFTKGAAFTKDSIKNFLFGQGALGEISHGLFKQSLKTFGGLLAGVGTLTKRLLGFQSTATRQDLDDIVGARLDIIIELLRVHFNMKDTELVGVPSYARGGALGTQISGIAPTTTTATEDGTTTTKPAQPGRTWTSRNIIEDIFGPQTGSILGFGKSTGFSTKEERLAEARTHPTVVPEGLGDAFNKKYGSTQATRAKREEKRQAEEASKRRTWVPLYGEDPDTKEIVDLNDPAYIQRKKEEAEAKAEEARLIEEKAKRKERFKKLYEDFKTGPSTFFRNMFKKKEQQEVKQEKQDELQSKWMVSPDVKKAFAEGNFTYVRTKLEDYLKTHATKLTSDLKARLDTVLTDLRVKEFRQLDTEQQPEEEVVQETQPQTKHTKTRKQLRKEKKKAKLDAKKAAKRLKQEQALSFLNSDTPQAPMVGDVTGDGKDDSYDDRVRREKEKEAAQETTLRHKFYTSFLGIKDFFTGKAGKEGIFGKLFKILKAPVALLTSLVGIGTKIFKPIGAIASGILTMTKIIGKLPMTIFKCATMLLRGITATGGLQGGVGRLGRGARGLRFGGGLKKLLGGAALTAGSMYAIDKFFGSEAQAAGLTPEDLGMQESTSQAESAPQEMKNPLEQELNTQKRRLDQLAKEGSVSHVTLGVGPDGKGIKIDARALNYIQRALLKQHPDWTWDQVRDESIRIASNPKELETFFWKTIISPASPSKVAEAISPKTQTKEQLPQSTVPVEAPNRASVAPVASAPTIQYEPTSKMSPEEYYASKYQGEVQGIFDDTEGHKGSGFFGKAGEIAVDAASLAAIGGVSSAVAGAAERKAGQMAGSIVARTALRGVGFGAKAVGFGAAGPVGWALLGADAIDQLFFDGKYGQHVFNYLGVMEDPFVKERCKIYGVNTDPGFWATMGNVFGGSILRQVVKLEEETYDTIMGKRAPFNDRDLEVWTDKFGLDEDDPLQVTYWSTWYKHRFIPSFQAYLTALGIVKEKFENSYEMPVGKKERVLSIMQHEALKSDLRPEKESFEKFKRSMEARKKQGGTSREDALAKSYLDKGANTTSTLVRTDTKYQPTVEQAGAMGFASGKNTVQAYDENAPGAPSPDGTPTGGQKYLEMMNEIKKATPGAEKLWSGPSEWMYDEKLRRTYDFSGPKSSTLRASQASIFLTPQKSSIYSTGRDFNALERRQAPTFSSYTPTTATPYTPMKFNFPSQGGSSGDRLGQYIKQFESGKEGSAATSWDAAKYGGGSYGTYQLTATQANKGGSLHEFLAWTRTKYPQIAQQLEPLLPSANDHSGHTADGQFARKWKELVQAGVITPEIEYEYYYKFFYQKALNNLRKKNPQAAALVEQNRGLQEAFWSTTVQHGPNIARGENTGSPNIFANAFNDANGDLNAWVDNIYRRRAGGGSFGGLKSGVVSRFKKEVNVIKGLLGQKAIAGAPATSMSTVPTLSRPQANVPGQSEQSGASGIVQRALAIMQRNAQGARYSQDDRAKPGYYDCTSFVGRSYKEAGADIDPLFTTASAHKVLTPKRGWEWHPGDAPAISQLQPGDVLWYRRKGAGHVETYMGNGMIIGAHGSKDEKYRKNPELQVSAVPLKSTKPYMGFFRLAGAGNIGPVSASPEALGASENSGQMGAASGQPSVGPSAPMSTGGLGSSPSMTSAGFSPSNPYARFGGVSLDEPGTRFGMSSSVNTSGIPSTPIGPSSTPNLPNASYGDSGSIDPSRLAIPSLPTTQPTQSTKPTPAASYTRPVSHIPTKRASFTPEMTTPVTAPVRSGTLGVPPVPSKPEPEKAETQPSLVKEPSISAKTPQVNPESAGFGLAPTDTSWYTEAKKKSEQLRLKAPYETRNYNTDVDFLAGLGGDTSWYTKAKEQAKMNEPKKPIDTDRVSLSQVGFGLAPINTAWYTEAQKKFEAAKGPFKPDDSLSAGMGLTGFDTSWYTDAKKKSEELRPKALYETRNYDTNADFLAGLGGDTSWYTEAKKAKDKEPLKPDDSSSSGFGLTPTDTSWYTKAKEDVERLRPKAPYETRNYTTNADFLAGLGGDTSWYTEAKKKSEAAKGTFKPNDSLSTGFGLVLTDTSWYTEAKNEAEQQRPKTPYETRNYNTDVDFLAGLSGDTSWYTDAKKEVEQRRPKALYETRNYSDLGFSKKADEAFTKKYYPNQSPLTPINTPVSTPIDASLDEGWTESTSANASGPEDTVVRESGFMPDEIAQRRKAKYKELREQYDKDSPTQKDIERLASGQLRPGDFDTNGFVYLGQDHHKGDVRRTWLKKSQFDQFMKDRDIPDREMAAQILTSIRGSEQGEPYFKDGAVSESVIKGRYVTKDGKQEYISPEDIAAERHHKSSREMAHQWTNQKVRDLADLEYDADQFAREKVNAQAEKASKRLSALAHPLTGAQITNWDDYTDRVQTNYKFQEALSSFDKTQRSQEAIAKASRAKIGDDVDGQVLVYRQALKGSKGEDRHEDAWMDKRYVDTYLDRLMKEDPTLTREQALEELRKDYASLQYASNRPMDQFNSGLVRQFQYEAAPKEEVTQKAQEPKAPDKQSSIQPITPMPSVQSSVAPEKLVPQTAQPTVPTVSEGGIDQEQQEGLAALQDHLEQQQEEHTKKTPSPARKYQSGEVIRQGAFWQVYRTPEEEAEIAKQQEEAKKRYKEDEARRIAEQQAAIEKTNKDLQETRRTELVTEEQREKERQARAKAIRLETEQRTFQNAIHGGGWEGGSASREEVDALRKSFEDDVHTSTRRLGDTKGDFIYASDALEFGLHSNQEGWMHKKDFERYVQQEMQSNPKLSREQAVQAALEQTRLLSDAQEDRTSQFIRVHRGGHAYLDSLKRDDYLKEYGQKEGDQKFKEDYSRRKNILNRLLSKRDTAVALPGVDLSQETEDMRKAREAKEAKFSAYIASKTANMKALEDIKKLPPDQQLLKTYETLDQIYNAQDADDAVQKSKFALYRSHMNKLLDQRKKDPSKFGSDSKIASAVKDYEAYESDLSDSEKREHDRYVQDYTSTKPEPVQAVLPPKKETPKPTTPKKETLELTTPKKELPSTELTPDNKPVEEKKEEKPITPSLPAPSVEKQPVTVPVHPVPQEEDTTVSTEIAESTVEIPSTDLTPANEPVAEKKKEEAPTPQSSYEQPKTSQTVVAAVTPDNKPVEEKKKEEAPKAEKKSEEKAEVSEKTESKEEKKEEAKENKKEEDKKEGEKKEGTEKKKETKKTQPKKSTKKKKSKSTTHRVRAKSSAPKAVPKMLAPSSQAPATPSVSEATPQAQTNWTPPQAKPAAMGGVWLDTPNALPQSSTVPQAVQPYMPQASSPAPQMQQVPQMQPKDYTANLTEVTNLLAQILEANKQLPGMIGELAKAMAATASQLPQQQPQLPPTYDSVYSGRRAAS